MRSGTRKSSASVTFVFISFHYFDAIPRPELYLFFFKCHNGAYETL